MSKFVERIDAFNRMYGIPRPEKPQFEGSERLAQFQRMLEAEVHEGYEVVPPWQTTQLDVLVSLVDWLGDVIVYCASEARRHGLPLDKVLDIIMDSNASKLQADGTAKFVDGKLQKGPNYWKPEPKIRELLEGLMK